MNRYPSCTLHDANRGMVSRYLGAISEVLPGIDWEIGAEAEAERVARTLGMAKQTMRRRGRIARRAMGTAS